MRKTLLVASIAGAIAASATVETDSITIDPDRLLELKPGDFVVHLEHGVGIYRGIAVAGCEPDEMGIGPVFAVPRLLERAGLSRVMSVVVIGVPLRCVLGYENDRSFLS